MSDAWYLDASEYYVGTGTEEYPLRQGDLIAGPTVGGEPWAAAQVVHPTCELGKRTLREAQVVRVRPLSDAPDDFTRGLLVAGFREEDGERRVAVAHTFFLPPWADGAPPCFASFREIATIPAPIKARSRVAATSHDCRVAFIRRWLYFRFRLAFTFEQVRAWEATRIANDPAFVGPKPTWATPN